MANNRINKVAIVGATGHLATHITSALLKTGKHSITAITRQDSTSKFPEGVNVARVDYTSTDSLISALRGHDFLIITLPGQVDPAIHPNIVNAAAKAGIPYVMPNVYGYDILNDRLNDNYVYGHVSKQCIADVVNAGVNYVALCCGFWYEWSLPAGEAFCGFNIEERKVTFFDEGTVKINTSTMTLCGKAVANLLSLPIVKEKGSEPALEDWKNKPLYISSFLVSQRDMLDSLHRALGTSDADWTITTENSEERVKIALEQLAKGEFLGFAKALYTRVFYPTRDGDYESIRGLHNGALGLEDEDFDVTTKGVLEKAGKYVEDQKKGLETLGKEKK